MVNSNQKTGRLNLENNDERGVILFNEGELVHVEFKGVVGKDAFYEIIGIEEGRFKFTQGLTHKEKQFDVLGGFMGMIMEGMKRLDDRA